MRTHHLKFIFICMTRYDEGHGDKQVKVVVKMGHMQELLRHESFKVGVTLMRTEFYTSMSPVTSYIF